MAKTFYAVVMKTAGSVQETGASGSDMYECRVCGKVVNGELFFCSTAQKSNVPQSWLLCSSLGTGKKELMTYEYVLFGQALGVCIQVLPSAVRLD